MQIFHRIFYCLFLLSALGCQRDTGASVLMPAMAAASTLNPAKTVSQREYRVRLRLDLVNAGPGRPEKQNLWVALIQTFPPYQELLSMDVSPAGYTLVSDEFGNQYAEFDFSDQPAGETRSVEIVYRVVVNELVYNLADCSGEMPTEFTRPELHIESANPQIVALAGELVGKLGNSSAISKTTPCQQVRVFYDYTSDELVYSANEQNWGAQAALGPMGADCTEYASLLAALSRAQGIPARYFEGLLFKAWTRSPGPARTCLGGCLPARQRLDGHGPHPGALLDLSKDLFCPLHPRPYHRHDGVESLHPEGFQLLDAPVLAREEHRNPPGIGWLGD